LTQARPGLLGAATARAEAQVLRLSALYALLDKSNCIRREHLAGALAFWDYCERSAEYVFGDSLGDAVADKALSVLRDAGERGLIRTELVHVFGKNKPGRN
jgi:hypothetical protein